MTKSCVYCGRIHARDYVCPKKPKIEYKKYDSKDTRASRFRSSAKWKKIRDSVYQRDLCLCQMCLSIGLYNSNDIEVHHIKPINEDWDARTDEDNLISLCKVHHELAEKGRISREKLLSLVQPGTDEG